MLVVEGMKGGHGVRAGMSYKYLGEETRSNGTCRRFEILQIFYIWNLYIPTLLEGDNSAARPY